MSELALLIVLWGVVVIVLVWVVLLAILTLVSWVSPIVGLLTDWRERKIRGPVASPHGPVDQPTDRALRRTRREHHASQKGQENGKKNR